MKESEGTDRKMVNGWGGKERKKKQSRAKMLFRFVCTNDVNMPEQFVQLIRVVSEMKRKF